MKDLDWTTYVPRRVYNAARMLETACANADEPLSPISEAEWRMTGWPTASRRALWSEVWRFLMEEYCVGPECNFEVVIVDDPAFKRLCSVSPRECH